MTLKEQYWQTGNIFEFNTGEKRFVWNDNLINEAGYVPKILFNDNLVNTNSTIGEHVIRIYSPNNRAGYFNDLIKTKSSDLLWQRSEHIYTLEELKKKLGIPNDKEVVIINPR